MADSSETVRLRIHGMTCGGCVARVEKALQDVPGVRSARVNLATETATVALNDPPAGRDELIGGVRGVGYDAEPVRPAVEAATAMIEAHQAPLRAQKQALFQAIGLSVPILGVHWLAGGLQSHAHGGHVWPQAIQAILSALLLISPAAAPILVGGIRAVQHRIGNMDLLISMGVGTAFVAGVADLFAGHSDSGHFHAAAMILAFINLGRYLEAKAKRDASAGLIALMNRMPKTAHRVTTGGVRQVGVEELMPGDLVRVAQDMVIPVDGVIEDGEAAVDESAVTGESIPRHCGAGRPVAAGSMVRDGLLTLRVTRIGAESTLGRIARAVEEAQTGKTRMQRLADRVAGVFVPIVIGLALVTLLGTHFARDASWSLAIQRTVAVLVIACPCALGLATPMAVLVSTGAAARKGILIRDASALEAAGSVDTVLFDKTGTLTTGRHVVSQTVVASTFDLGSAETGDPRSEVLRLAASAEFFSQHPLARAIVAAARELALPLDEPTDFTNRPGSGVIATVKGRVVRVGSRRLMAENGTACDDNLLTAVQHGPRAVVWVAVDTQCVGAVVLADELRSEASSAIAALRKLGLSVALVTGDHEQTAREIGTALGITKVRAGMTPDGKLEEVHGIQAAGRRVAFVGDGINDAPALAAADVGITFASATDVATGSADVTILQDDLSRVAEVVVLARRSLRIIKQNLFWAFFYNVVAIPLAAAGTVPPGVAAAAMMFSSISVVLNSLRLRTWNHAGKS